ncbi:hypothetical protein CIK05_11955 [Bdellovibrio sp. qaytius]|nr:hypothetical protein CIK05_11955 [Bdellovibrio sp. qaytius]
MNIKKISKLICICLILTAVNAPASEESSIPNELGAPKAYETSADYSVQYGSVKVANELQRVIVTIPNKTGPHPALLLVGGLGCYSLDFSGAVPTVDAYKKIIEFMTKNGFVTMRVEKTGMGDSKGQACAEQNFDRELAGYVAGLKALKSYNFVNSDRVSIFGHSIGGVIAPLLIEQVPVHTVIVMGTLAERWYDYDHTNNMRQLLLSGMTPEQVTNEMKIHDYVAKEFFINKKTPAEILKVYPQGKFYLEFPAHYTYMQQLADLDLAKNWVKSSAKVFMLLGNGDFIGSQWPEIQKFNSGINKTREVKIQAEQVPSLDHFFRNADSMAESFYNISLAGTPLVFQDKFLDVLASKIPEMK